MTHQPLVIVVFDSTKRVRMKNAESFEQVLRNLKLQATINQLLLYPQTFKLQIM